MVRNRAREMLSQVVNAAIARGEPVIREQPFATIEDVQCAVLEGKRVFWKNEGYEVIMDDICQWLVVFQRGQARENCVGLTGEYSPADFFVGN